MQPGQPPEVANMSASSPAEQGAAGTSLARAAAVALVVVLAALGAALVHITMGPAEPLPPVFMDMGPAQRPGQATAPPTGTRPAARQRSQRANP